MVGEMQREREGVEKQLTTTEKVGGDGECGAGKREGKMGP